MNEGTKTPPDEKITHNADELTVSTDHAARDSAAHEVVPVITSNGSVAKRILRVIQKNFTKQELITLTFVALFLFGLVLYFGWISRADEVRIAYIKEDFYGSSLNRELAARQVNDPNLKARLLRALRSQIIGDSAGKCIEWLRSGDWDDACANSAIRAAELVRDELEEQDADLKADIATIEQRQNSGQPVLMPLQSSNYVLLSSGDPARSVGSLEILERKCEMELQSLGSLLEELKRVRREEHRCLTGRVDLLFAILNNSDHDHILNERATLSWENQELEMRADGDTIIKGRSVREIRFVIDRKDATDKLTNWEELVSHRSSKDYQVSVFTDQGTLRERGTLFKDGEASHHYASE